MLKIWNENAPLQLTTLDEGAIPHLPKTKKGFLGKVDPSSTTPTKTKGNVDIDDFK